MNAGRGDFAPATLRRAPHRKLHTALLATALAAGFGAPAFADLPLPQPVMEIFWNGIYR